MKPAERFEGFALGLLGWVLTPLLAAVVLFFGIQDVGPAWRAAHGQGTRGTFLATERECDRHTCGFYGTFTADDGSAVYEHVWLDSDPRGLAVGKTIEVYYAGGRSPRAVFLRGSHSWVLIALLIVAGIVALGFWGYLLFLRVTT